MRRRAFLTAALGSISGTAQTQTWQRRRIGANCFNRRVSPQWLEAAAAANISLVRLVYEKWGERDFLLLSADEYRALSAPHLRQLVAVLDGFYAKGIDGRIDDAKAGWKGKGIWTSISTRAPFHMEGGRGTTSKLVKFQVRPDPLSK